VGITIGVAVARNCADLAVVEVRRGKATLLFDGHIDRAEGQSPSVVLQSLLSAVPKDLARNPIHVALSWGEFACADALPLPGRVKSSAISKVAPGLCESRSAGEALEDLSIDVLPRGEGVWALALGSEILSGLTTVAGVSGLVLGLVTATPVALAEVLEDDASLQLVHGGERTEIRKEKGRAAWRVFPVNRAAWQEGGEIPTILGLQVTPGQAGAVAVALADPLVVPNILRGAPDAPRTFGARFHRPLSWLGVAAALFFLSLGLFFRAVEARSRSEQKAALAQEEGLWKKFLPERPRKQGELLRTMKEILKDSGGVSVEGDFPSALAFWAEIAVHLPDVEPMGMTLESLDLTPEGGRLSAVVVSVPGDPLRNAALLEGQLGLSERLAARGDYETREKDIQVRLKMDYRKPPLGGDR
jgi:hypothetical protein